MQQFILRDLYGNTIMTQSISNKEITIDLAKKIVDNYVKNTSREVSIDYIQKIVS